MIVHLGRYDFTLCPSLGVMEDKAGVYAVLCKQGDKYRVLDVGESATPKTRLATHERRPCWERNRDGAMMYAVYPTPFSTQRLRIDIEAELRRLYTPPCGQRPAQRA